MNATFNYIRPKVFFNGSINTGVVADLIQKKAHFAFNAQAYAPYNFNGSVEQTNPFDHIKLCVIVPKNGMKPIAFNIFHSLTPLTWIFVIGSIIVVTVALVIIQHLSNTIANVRQNNRTYTTIEFAGIALQSFFANSIKRVTLNLSIRCILLGWLIYSFLISNAFTATVISSLIKPNYIENINTIEELVESNLSILYPKVIGKNLKNGFDDETWDSIEDNLKEIETWEEFVEIMNQNKTQYGYVLADYYCLYMVNTNINEKTGESIFHMVRECLASHPKVYLFQRGSMYLGYVNELLGQFHEFGMFRRWIAETNFNSLIKGYKIGNRADPKAFNYLAAEVVMSMEYLQTPFYMLGFGLFLSVIIFGVEKLRHKIEPKNEIQNESIVEEVEFELI